jgi:uncharacterized protein (DUF488 family)
MSNEDCQYYEFVPYKYGAFSFTAYSDINGLKKEDTIYDKGNSFVLREFDRKIYKITTNDYKNIENIYHRFNGKTADDLMRITYERYPYYTKNSMKKEFITPTIENSIKMAISKDDNTTLFDIGYEGKSLEGYLNLLIKININMLIDVRRNPVSMKYGFSKNILEKRISDLNIKYIHIPQLGIESDKRQSLNSFEDYQKLFANYEATTLKQNIESVKEIYDILIKNKKIALTCFEADKNYCHRYRIVNLMNAIYPNKFAMGHL